MVLLTQFGDFRIIPFKQKSNGVEHVALKGIGNKTNPF